MGGSHAGEAGTAQRLRHIAAELRGLRDWPLDTPGQRAEDLAASLERAADLLAAAAATPAPPPARPPAADLAELPCVLHADGGSRGNPGPAGAGAALLDASGQELATWHRYLGLATNNVAEYQGLLMGLAGALELGVRRLTVRLDSELLVRQLQGRYQVKSPHLKPLYEQARALAARFAAIKFQHIPREQNAIADRLANLAMDER